MFTEDADVVLSSDVALETEFADMNITTVPMFRSITVAAKELNSIKQMVVSPKCLIEPLEEEDPCPITFRPVEISDVHEDEDRPNYRSLSSDCFSTEHQSLSSEEQLLYDEWQVQNAAKRQRNAKRVESAQIARSSTHNLKHRLAALRKM